MFKSIFTKTIYTLRWSTFGWILGIMAVAFLTMVFYNSFSQTNVDSLVNSVPKELQSLIGDVDDFKTVAGYIGQQIFGPNLYILIIIMSILLFVSISAREEENGVLQTLMSLPVSRTQIYFHKLVACLTSVAVIIASTALALWFSLMIIGHTADFGRIWQSLAELFLMAIAYGLIAYAISMATGQKSLTILVASVYAGGSFLISMLAPAVDKLSIVDKLSLIHYYNSPQVMTHGWDLENLIVLGSVCIVLILIGWIGYLRRDVRTS